MAAEGGPPGDLPVIRAVSIVHQEGVIASVALVGLWFREPGLAAALRPREPGWMWLPAAVSVAAAGLLLTAGARVIPAVRHLEEWQRAMVASWSVGDALAVAFISGLAEEALVRALLQPWLGLWAAAGIFAALHVVPDRRMWAWPVTALVLGIGLGLVFEKYGYPAAALAHMVLNGVSLVRLRLPAGQD